MIAGWSRALRTMALRTTAFRATAFRATAFRATAFRATAFRATALSPSPFSRALARSTLVLLLTFVVTMGAFGSGRGEPTTPPLADDDLESVLAYYEKAAIDNPESATILYNKSVVLYRMEDFNTAAEGFGQAALKTKDLSLEAKATYNRGNSLFMQGEMLQESDLEGALDLYQASVAAYERALELDRDMEQAARNIEVVRIVMKALLDELQKQQQEMQHQQEQIQKIIESLEQLIGQQQGHIDQANTLNERSQDRDYSPELAKLAVDQDDTREATLDIAQQLEQLGSPQADSPIQEAQRHLQRATIDQGIASELLTKDDIGSALDSQAAALNLLELALDALTDQDQAQQPPRPQEQPEAGPQSAPDQPQADEQAQDILREEAEDRRRRETAGRTQYRDVDRDW